MSESLTEKERVVDRRHAAGLILFEGFLATGTPAWACQQFPTIYFPFGSAQPYDEGLAQLRGFARQALINLEQIERISIVGHSDRTGPRRARERIASRRAAAVRDLLARYGVPPTLLFASGAGDRQRWTETGDNIRAPLNRSATLTVSFKVPTTVSRGANGAEGAPAPLC